jgi:hypothetical protein
MSQDIYRRAFVRRNFEGYIGAQQSVREPKNCVSGTKECAGSAKFGVRCTIFLVIPDKTVNSMACDVRAMTRTCGSRPRAGQDNVTCFEYRV